MDPPSAHLALTQTLDFSFERLSERDVLSLAPPIRLDLPENRRFAVYYMLRACVFTSSSRALCDYTTPVDC
jgi:hypothetical protein